MNNTQKFIASEFDYISSNVPETSRVFKPTITISHGAFSKDIFAQGALRAVLFIKDKPAGLYGMDDLL